LAPKAGLKDVLLFLGMRVADYATALLLYRCNAAFFLRHELNRSLVLALQTGFYTDLIARETLWFMLVIGGLRASIYSSRWISVAVSRILVESFSYILLLSLGIGFCGVTANIMCIVYVLLGLKHPLESGFRDGPPRLGEAVSPLLFGLPIFQR